MSTLCDSVELGQSTNSVLCRPNNGYGKLGAENKSSKWLTMSADDIFEQWPFPFVRNINGPCQDGLWSTWTYPVKQLKTTHIFGTLIELLGCPNEGWARNAYYGLLDLIQHGSEAQIIQGLQQGGIHGFRKLFSNSPHISSTWDGFAAGLDILERLLTCTNHTCQVCVQGLGRFIRPISRIYKLREQYPISITNRNALTNSITSKGMIKSIRHPHQLKVFSGRSGGSKKQNPQLAPQVINQILGGAPQFSYEPKLENWLARVETLVAISSGLESREYCNTVREIKLLLPTYESLQSDNKCTQTVRDKLESEKLDPKKPSANSTKNIAQKSHSVSSTGCSVFKTSRIQRTRPRPRYGPLTYNSGPAPCAPGSLMWFGKLTKISEPEPIKSLLPQIPVKHSSSLQIQLDPSNREISMPETEPSLSLSSSQSQEFKLSENQTSTRQSLLERKANDIVLNILSGVQVQMTKNMHGYAHHQLYPIRNVSCMDEETVGEHISSQDDQSDDTSHEDQAHAFAFSTSIDTQQHHYQEQHSLNLEHERESAARFRYKSAESNRETFGRLKHAYDSEDLAMIEDLESMQTELNGVMEEYSDHDAHPVATPGSELGCSKRILNSKLENDQRHTANPTEVHYDFQVVESSAFVGPLEDEMEEKEKKPRIVFASLPATPIIEQHKQPSQGSSPTHSENIPAAPADYMHQSGPIKITRVSSAPSDENKDNVVKTIGSQLAMRISPTTRMIEINKTFTPESNPKGTFNQDRLAALSTLDSSEQVSGWSTLAQTGSDEFSSISTNGPERYIFRIHASQREGEQNAPFESINKQHNFETAFSPLLTDAAAQSEQTSLPMEIDSSSSSVFQSRKAVSENKQDENTNKQPNQEISCRKSAFISGSEQDKVLQIQRASTSENYIHGKVLSLSQDLCHSRNAASETSTNDAHHRSSDTQAVNQTSTLTVVPSPGTCTLPITVTKEVLEPPQPSLVNASVGPGLKPSQLIPLHLNVQARASWEDGNSPFPVVFDTQINTTPPHSVDNYSNGE